MGEGHENYFGGEAHSVFQARQVYGDVYFAPPREKKVPRQVPKPPKHHTNYEAQLGRLDEILAGGGDGPQVAIVGGTPGSGRSTLCFKWVHSRDETAFPDGDFYVRLGLASERALDVLGELLHAVGYGPDEIPAGLDARSAKWRTWSYGKRIALVIDDALLPAEINALIPGAGPSAVLVVSGDDSQDLQTRHSGRYVDIEPLSEEASRALLARMTGQARLDEGPDAARELVRLCSGSAIALNVAGAMIVRRPIDRVLRMIQRKGGVLDALSITTVFDVVYDLLSPLAQASYRVLGVHPGDGDVSALTVADTLGEDLDDVSDALQDLVKRHLVQEVDDDRYLIGGLVRAHSATKADGELLKRLITAYRGRGIAAEAALPRRGWMSEISPNLTVEPLESEGAAREWLSAERANLEAVVESAYGLGLHEWVCQLCLVLWPVHLGGEYPGEMYRVNERGVEAARELPGRLPLAVMLFQLGFAHRQARQWDQAAALFHEAREIAAETGSVTVEATALESLGLVKLDQGEHAEAERHLAENLALAEQIGEPRRIALARFHLAKVRPLPAALDLLDAAAALLGKESLNKAKVALWRGKKLLAGNEFSVAAETLADASLWASDGGHHRERAEVAEAQAELSFASGRNDEGRSYLEDARNIYLQRGFTFDGVRVRARLAALPVEDGSPEG